MCACEPVIERKKEGVRLESAQEGLQHTKVEVEVHVNMCVNERE